MQPDYSALFRRETIRPLRFQVRRLDNYVHDVQFLSSYLHDARFTPTAVTRRGKKLRIVMDRDCWELGLVRKAESSELYTAKSRLTLGPVSSVRWEIDDPSTLGQELWVESIYIGAAHWETPDTSEIVLSAPHTESPG
ncbi:hypothetical protein P12x_000339 [Tundrisphaera lichenicola]|uniref:hypothetical protein n=1 Tax=Tundrisphaera lichenicola TaxID=2029860 RepID=UPI003EBF2B8D